MDIAAFLALSLIFLLFCIGLGSLIKVIYLKNPIEKNNKVLHLTSSRRLHLKTENQAWIESQTPFILKNSVTDELIGVSEKAGRIDFKFNPYQKYVSLAPGIWELRYDNDVFMHFDKFPEGGYLDCRTWVKMLSLLLIFPVAGVFYVMSILMISTLGM